MERLDSKPLPRGAKRTWIGRYQRSGFLRGKSALYGLRIVLTLENARALSSALNGWVKLAEEHSCNNIEIDAHFGRSTDEGFKLAVRVFRPEEKD